MSDENNPSSCDAAGTFGQPDHTNLKSLTDGRSPATPKSVYGCSAWFQIIFELSYLLFMLFGALILLLLVMKVLVIGGGAQFFPSAFGEYPNNKPILMWITLALGGVCGGCAAALKWLYHTVAKQHWHHDRLVWRIVVPILAAVMALFVGLMINSGLIPEGKFGAAAGAIPAADVTTATAETKGTFLSNPTTVASFGFFIGLFSDYALASLQNLARRIFGTTKDGSE